MWRGLALVAALCAGMPASAQQQLAFNGSLGGQAALLMIDGQPHTVRIGQTVQGVRLVALEGDHATVEVDGVRRSLTMGATQASIGSVAGGGAGRQIVLSSGPGGHFTATGSINGHATQFLVDTGATAMAIGQPEAERLGLKFRSGRPVMAQTANGAAQAWLISLTTVRIGDVEVHNVEAIVVPGQMSHILLGNSFLSRFQMRRDNDILTLDLRY
jgi:aspartyl protease family protein